MRRRAGDAHHVVCIQYVPSIRTTTATMTFERLGAGLIDEPSSRMAHSRPWGKGFPNRVRRDG